MKKIISILFIASLLVLILDSTSYCQSTYTAALRYAMPIMKVVPPIDSSQPGDIQGYYLWLDQAFRWVRPGGYMDRYLKGLQYNDTSKFIAKVLYNLVDYDPITFRRWSASFPVPYPYNAAPGKEREIFRDHFGEIANDTGRSRFLLYCDYIFDIHVSDTIVFYWDSTHFIHKTIIVTYGILDTIKGKQVPECTNIFHTKNGSPKPMSIDTTTLVAIHSAPGVCSQFEYSPEWTRSRHSTGVGTPDPLHDSTGDWIKRDSEYIVFLTFTGLDSDSTYGYWNLMPRWGLLGSSGAMYRVNSGHVVDPNDDFGIGANISGGLPVSAWKSRLRSRIHKITNP